MSTFCLKLTDARSALERVSFLTAKSTHFFNGSSASLGLLSHAIRTEAFADMVIVALSRVEAFFSLTELLLHARD
jgi:hypothetical protein